MSNQPFAMKTRLLAAGCEVRSLAVLPWPLIGSNMVISGMQFIDIIMAGQIGGVDLAAVGVGSNVWLFFLLASQGVLMALSPIVSHHHGAGNWT